MHALIRQRGPGRAHFEIPGRGSPARHAHVRLRTGERGQRLAPEAEGVDVEEIRSVDLGRGVPGERKGEFPGREFYRTPAHEFEVHRLSFEHLRSHTLDRIDRPAILIVLSGLLRIQASRHGGPANEANCRAGSVVFFPGDLAARETTLELSGVSNATACLAQAL